MGKAKVGPNPSKLFHKKVEKILKEAGFTIEKSNYYAEGPDIIASVEGYRFLIQCKRAEEDDTPFPRINSLIDEYSRKVEKERAKAAILAFKRYKLPKSLDFNKRKHHLEKDKVAIWDEQTVDYYAQVSRALGEYAKYPMLSDLGIRKKFSRDLCVPAIKIRQKDKEFFLFKISPEVLLKIAYVARKQLSPEAYQRIVSPTRVRRDIAGYLKEEEGIFPTNIVCAFKENVRFDEKSSKLKIPMRYGSVWIVDGQHRLYGFCHVKERKIRENFELMCAGFNVKNSPKSRLKDYEEGKMFVTINEKAKKITRILLLDLYDLIGRENRKVEVVKKLAEMKPFKEKIKIKERDKGPISLATFALTPPMEDLVGNYDSNNGLISMYYGKSRRQKRTPTDFYVRMLEKYFLLVQKNFKKEWKNSKDYFLAQDRGIRALLRLFRDILDYSNGLRDKRKVNKCLRALKNNFSFKERKEYYGEGGAERLYQECVAAIQLGLDDLKFGPKSELTSSVGIKRDERKRAEKELKNIFSELEGDIIGILPYIDKATFKYLDYIPATNGVRLITFIVSDPEKCREAAAAAARKRRYFSIRHISCVKKDGKPFSPTHYDRFIASKEKYISLGVDLKKEALKKEYEIKVFNRPYLQKSYRAFEELWKYDKEQLKEHFKQKPELEDISVKWLP